MNTQETIRKTISTTLFTILLGTATNQALIADDALDQFYRNILFNPSKAILLAEAQGRVTIYDGLDSKVVDHVMETQFGRIENMMFVGIRHTLPDGSIEVEDDDCDN